MPPRKSPSSAEEQSDRLAEAVEHLTDRLKALQDSIDDAVVDITHEVRKLLGEMTHPISLRSMPLDPCQKPFKINEAPDPPQAAPAASNTMPKPKSGPKKSLFSDDSN